MSAEFASIMAEDPKVSARFDAASDAVIAHFAERGVTITRDDILSGSSPTVRLACLTESEPLDIDRAAKELATVPSIAEGTRRAELKAALEAKETETLDQIYSLPRYQRMEIGRQLKATEDRQKATMTVEEEAEKINLLRQVKDRATKMTLARDWGLV